MNGDTDKIIQDLSDTEEDSPESSPLNQSSSSYSSDSTATEGGCSVVTEPAIAFNIYGHKNSDRCSVVTDPPFTAAGNNNSPARQTTNVLQRRPAANARKGAARTASM